MNLIPYKDRTINFDKPVMVYRNLNCKSNNEKYSVMQSNLVVAHTNLLKLTDVKFIVRKYGKKKAIDTGERNVHAFMRGYVSSQTIRLDDETYNKVHYDPFTEKHFMISNNITITYSKAAIIKESGVYASQ